MSIISHLPDSLLKAIYLPMSVCSPVPDECQTNIKINNFRNYISVASVYDVHDLNTFTSLAVVKMYSDCSWNREVPTCLLEQSKKCNVV